MPSTIRSGAGGPASPPAGYSGTPLPKKLGIKQDSVLALIDAPASFCSTLGDLPPGVSVRTDLRRPAGMAVFFAVDAAACQRALRRLASVLEAGGGTWIAWPKKTSGIATDIDENLIRARAIAAGLVDIKVCALDATWSGLRIARRRSSSRSAASASASPSTSVIDAG